LFFADSKISYRVDTDNILRRQYPEIDNTRQFISQGGAPGLSSTAPGNNWTNAFNDI
jgi:hypothetical protein